MTKLLKKILKTPLELAASRKFKKATYRLLKHEDATLAAIGVAMHELLTNEWAEDEKQSIHNIEKRRQALLESNSTIDIIDYGAGSSLSKRTQKEMHNGVKSTRMVSTVAGASKPPFWAALLYKLIRHTKPISCVELGSCVGISAAYQAEALKANGSGGKLTTLEGSESIAAIAKKTFDTLKLNNVHIEVGPFHETLNDVMADAEPIDFFFNDGHHDHDAVLRYFNDALPFIAENAVIVFDDISWSTGMRKAWKEIEQHERVSATIDLYVIGIAVISSRMSFKTIL